jgi:hypothetical protein
MEAISLALLQSMQRVESNLLATPEFVGRGYGWIVHAGARIPLADARVQVPAVEVDPLAGDRQLIEQPARRTQVATFEVDQADDNIRDLNAGVVDVVLHANLVAGLEVVGAKQALEGVAKDGVAQMADVRRFIGVDAGVLDQPKSRTADIGVPIGRDCANCSRAVQLDVQISRSGDFNRRDAGKLIESRVQLCSELRRNCARRLAKSLGQFKCDRQSKFAQRNIRRLLHRELRQGNVVFAEQDGLNAGQQGELDCAIHASRVYRSCSRKPKLL